MKKLLIVLLAGFMSFAAVSQNKDVDAAQVPKAVSEQFTREHPGITPSWKADGKLYKAYYTDSKTNMGQLVVYDDKGNVQRRESELDKLAYPSSINDYHSRNFPGESYKLWSVDDKTGVRTYYSERNQQLMWFDKNGNYVTPKEKNVQVK